MASECERDLQQEKRTHLAAALRHRQGATDWGILFMFSLTHSPLPSGLLAKFTNTPSGGVHVVKTHLVFVGQPIHALPRMLGESENTANRNRLRHPIHTHHDEWQDVPSEGSGVGVEFCSSET